MLTKLTLLTNSARSLWEPRNDENGNANGGCGRKILDAARDAVRREGYEAVSMRKIAEAIEYSPTAIYVHFADKDRADAASCARTTSGGWRSVFQRPHGRSPTRSSGSAGLGHATSASRSSTRTTTA